MIDLDRRPPPTEFGERIGLRVVKLLEACNVSTFRLSDGRVGGTIFGQPVVLLTASGAKTGRRRVKPLLALAEEGSWCVIASRGGTRNNPDWYVNLQAWAAGAVTESGAPLQPPTIEAAGMNGPVEVAVAFLYGDEREAVWAQLVSAYRKFDSYQERVPGRRIPVVRFTPH